MRRKTSGLTGVEVVVVLAVIGAVAWLVKPSAFPGASKRAANSTAATERVESATIAQGAAVAASVVKIGEANSEAPASPSKSFIAREVPVALALLPAPDSQALIEAERRKVAVMEGRLEEARKLYESAAKSAEKLQNERDAAVAARRNADSALEKAAAAEHARTIQAIGAGFVALIFLALFVYAKAYGISTASAGRIAADIRAGVAPLVALDTHLSPRLHARVSRAAKLASDLK